MATVAHLASTSNVSGPWILILTGACALAKLGGLRAFADRIPDVALRKEILGCGRAHLRWPSCFGKGLVVVPLVSYNNGGFILHGDYPVKMTIQYIKENIVP